VTVGADVQVALGVLKDYSGSFENGIPPEMIRMSDFACYAPWSVLIIEPDGTIHLCRDGVSNGMGMANGMGMSNNCSEGIKKYNSSLGTLGNIKNTPLKELWNNKIAQNWRKSIIEMKELPPSCLNCCLIARTKNQ